MADDTDTEAALSDLAQYGVGAAGTMGANAVTQKAYQAILQNLRDRFSDYSNLKPAGYQDITAQRLGPSALEGIQPDAQSRADEQAAVAQLDDIAKSGGLTLDDKAALDKIERTLGRSDAARRNSIANQYAARGQLGGGQQLQMELNSAQHATENANERGESTAAQAQKRAMEAVLEKGKASHAMSAEDYARKARAAEAADAIAKHNAAMATDAAKTNNDYRGRTYEDQLRKLGGENQVTGQLNTALLGSGQQNANTIAGATYGADGLINGLGKVASKVGKGARGGGGGSGDPNDPGLDQGGQNDLTGERGGPADLTGGSTDTTDDSEQWASWPGGE